MLHDSTAGADLLRNAGSYNDPYASVRQSICVPKNKCFTYVIGDYNDNYKVLMQGANFTKSFHGEYAETFVDEDTCLNFRMFGASDSGRCSTSNESSEHIQCR